MFDARSYEIDMTWNVKANLGYKKYHALAQAGKDAIWS